MGPPTQSPISLRSRNLTASRISEYLVAIPIRAVTHSQNRAPGPPRVTAAVIPAMLPVPTVPASAVETAWKGVISPSSAFCLVKILPRVFFIAWPKRRNCMPPMRMVIRMPVPISRTIITGPQTNPLIALLTLTIKSICNSFSFLPPNPKPYHKNSEFAPFFSFRIRQD